MSFWLGNYNFYLPSNMVVSPTQRYGILWVQKLLRLRVFFVASVYLSRNPPTLPSSVSCVLSAWVFRVFVKSFLGEL